MGIVKSALNLFGISKDGFEKPEGLEDFLKELTTLAGYSVEFNQVEKEESGLHYEIEGDEALAFVGDNSNMLDALAHLSMRFQRKTEGVANKALEEGERNVNLRVTFDSNGFRERKIEELKKLAEKARTKVMENNGKPSYLSALSPSERKVIHTHLVELGDVTSESIGNGNFKRIRIKLIRAERGQRSDSRNSEKPRGPRPPSRWGANKGKGNGRQNPKGNQKKFSKDANGDKNGNVFVNEADAPIVDDNIGNR